MRKIAKTYKIQFLNLGYAPNENETFSNILEIEFLTQHSLKYHYYLYEKALSLCPLYENLNKTSLLDVGCGIGSSIRWIRR